MSAQRKEQKSQTKIILTDCQSVQFIYLTYQRAIRWDRQFYLIANVANTQDCQSCLFPKPKRSTVKNGSLSLRVGLEIHLSIYPHPNRLLCTTGVQVG